MKSGIYKIENTVNGKVYIGQSVNIKMRFNGHRKDLKDGNHYSIHLQRAYNLFGADAFTFDIIEYCEPELLDEKEIYYIDLYKATDKQFGYNISLGGHAGVRIHSEESKKKMSTKLKGRKMSDKTKAKMSRSKEGNTNGIKKGQKLSDETRAKMSASRSGSGNHLYIEPTASMVYDAFSNMPSKQFREKHSVSRAYYYKFRKRIGAL